MPDALTPDEAAEVRRQCRALVASILDPLVETETRDRLSAEIAVDYRFDGILAMAAVALSLLRSLPGGAVAALERQNRRHPDNAVRERTDVLLTAYAEDVQVSARVREAVYTAGEAGGLDAVRDLALVAAGAVWDLALVSGESMPAVLQQLALLDETRDQRPH